jgi:hypothetical protein
MSDTAPEEVETPAHQVYDKNRNYDPTDGGETATEDMSMSMQRTVDPSDKASPYYGSSQKTSKKKFIHSGNKITSF